MKGRILLVVAAGASIATLGAARADSQVSIDLNALVLSSPIAGEARSSTVESIDGRRLVYAVMGDRGAIDRSGSSPDVTLGVELRPTFAFSSGLRVAVGFRYGRAGDFGDRGSFTDEDRTLQMWGGDVSLGYQRWLGARFLPWVDARFGFNDYSGYARVDQLRGSAVLGARCYLSQAVYLSASVFGGWGDRVGGTLGLGFDVVRYRYRGVLP